MELFEAGHSVACNILGKSEYKKTYVCVVDNAQEKTLEQALQEVKAFIGEKAKDFDSTTLTYTTITGEKYTLAHEVIINTSITMLPSNMLRHIFSRMYSYDAVYINEDGEFVDLINKGYQDICNNIIRPVHKDILQFLYIEPNNLLPLIDILLNKTKNIAGNLENILYEFAGEKRITELNKLEQILSAGSLLRNIEHLKQYSGLFNYLTAVCGLECKIRFVDVPLNKVLVEEIPLTYPKKGLLDQLEYVIGIDPFGNQNKPDPGGRVPIR